MAKRSAASIPQDQKVFRHANNMPLERFAESLFGKKYYKSVNRVDIGFWKAFCRFPPRFDPGFPLRTDPV